MIRKKSRVKSSNNFKAPKFQTPQHVNRPNSPNKDVFFALLDTVVNESNYSNNGPLVCELESKIATYLGVKHCILVSNGTLGLQLLIRALEIKGEVILPSFTFIATPNAVFWEGIEPVFCDITPGSATIDPVQCEKLITKNTSAILGVHVWGQQCDTSKLEDIATKNGLHLIFDAAHAFGCGSLNQGMIGSDGRAEVFSFHATKAFHTGEGGAITTNDSILANKLKKLRNFGFIDTDKTNCLGINAKMSELHAALGLVNFESLESNFKKSAEAHSLYSSNLGSIEFVHLLKYEDPHNFQYAVLFIKETSPLTRNELIQILEAENVLARRYFYPGCHHMEPYIEKNEHRQLPETDKLASSTLVLPAGANIKREDVKSICEIISRAFTQASFES